MKFNLNDIIKVKLENNGLEIIIYDHYQKFKDEEYTLEDRLKHLKYHRGYIEIQIWEFMQIFGRELEMGNNNLPFDMNVELLSTEVKYD